MGPVLTQMQIGRRLGARNADLRVESSFQASIAPAEGNVVKTIYLIIRDQMFFPLLQGFIWALFKDWYLVAAQAARIQGSRYGASVRLWLSQWLLSADKLQ